MEGIGIFLLLLSRLLALCGSATGSFQKVSGNRHGMSTSAALNAIHDVARAIARRKGNYIFISFSPRKNEPE